MNWAKKVATGFGIAAGAVTFAVGMVTLWRFATEPRGNVIAHAQASEYEPAPVDSSALVSVPLDGDDVKAALVWSGTRRVPADDVLVGAAARLTEVQKHAGDLQRLRSPIRIVSGFFRMTIENGGSQGLLGLRLRMRDVVAWCAQKEGQIRRCAYTGTPLDLGDLAPADRLSLLIWTGLPPAGYRRDEMRISHSAGITTVKIEPPDVPPSEFSERWPGLLFICSLSLWIAWIAWITGVFRSSKLEPGTSADAVESLAPVDPPAAT
jgi:hypothetical protein